MIENPYLRSRWAAVVLAAGVVLPAPLQAGDGALDGSRLGSAWLIPFAGILLSVAVLPLLAPHLWHRHGGKIALGWALGFLLPCQVQFGGAVAWQQAVHVLLLEYLPFVILIGTLYTVTGGVRLTGTWRATPAGNTAVLALGTLLASVMGTTGAAMLLIRPLLQANRHRSRRVHVVVFFIFLVANVGGALSPLGDPPIFIGFLQGVDFFWTTTHLLLPTAFLAGWLLTVFYLIDRHYQRQECGAGGVAPEPGAGMRLEGAANLGLLAGVVGVLLLQGVWQSGAELMVAGTRIPLTLVVANLLLLAIAGLSLWLTPCSWRRDHGFGWEPLAEVAKLFAAIFVTIVPALAMLRAGTAGALAPLLALVSADGQPVNTMYFWVTGLLSGLLDNAPTYLIFFNAAGGDPAWLSTDGAGTLAAISAGAVYMGALTYIGNAPNIMVKAMAEREGVPMPGFLGYCGWSLLFLIPPFLSMTMLGLL